MFVTTSSISSPIPILFQVTQVEVAELDVCFYLLDKVAIYLLIA